MESNKFVKFLKLDKVVEDLTAYVETRLKLFKIEAREEIAEIISKVFQAGLIFLIGFLFVVFLSVAAAIFLGNMLGNQTYGFLIISGIYLILSIFLVFWGDKLKLSEKIFKHLEKPLKDKDDERL